jgi:sugar-phosphatase
MILSQAAMKVVNLTRRDATLNAVLEVSAIIFDLDGVLADSSAVVDHAWIEWGDRHGIDAGLIRRTIPGKRNRDAVTLLAPTSDIDGEAARIPGASTLLAQLPAGRWGVATSGTDAIARSRLAHAGLPLP